MAVWDIIRKTEDVLNTTDRAKSVGKRAKNTLPPIETKKEEPKKEEKKEAAVPSLDKDRAKAIGEMLSSPELIGEMKYYGKNYGDGAVPAGKEIVNMYLKAAEKKPFAGPKEEDIKKFLDSYETLKEGKRSALTDKEKEGAREMAWGAFSTMKGMILDRSLDSKYDLVVTDGPVASKADPTKFSQITVLGPKK